MALDLPKAEGELGSVLGHVRPTSRAALRGWIQGMLNIVVPDRAICTDHHCPMDYLEHAFFEYPGDALIWANRGGGKTFYGALATLLDMLFKPGVEIRILGGSRDQSSRMYEYLRWMLDRPGLRERIEGTMTQQAVTLDNGSRVQVLAQSQTSVRGHRVQKLRCDEVELFDREVWQAAQFVTRSKQCGEIAVRGAVECFSTMHRPYGLMHELVRQCEVPTGDKAQASRFAMFRWCVLDVLRTCEAGRPCEGCVLWDACEGRAKDAAGFIAVQDAIDQAQRSAHQSFASEMLCRKPNRSDSVFAMFAPQHHVRTMTPAKDATWIGGIDFGFRSPFVMLWAALVQHRHMPLVYVVDEYVRSEKPLQHHIEAIRQRDTPIPRWIGADPAGHQRSDQTGNSNITTLRRAGLNIRTMRSAIAPGLEKIRSLLDHTPTDTDAPDQGLVIHPRCTQLIEAMASYHFDADRPWREVPIKDGHDHLVDALRYMIIQLDRSASVTIRNY